MTEQVALQLDEPDVIVRLMLTFDRAADDFLGDCARRGFTPRTIQTYARTYRLLADRLPKDQDVSKITTDDLRRFLGAHTHLAAGTVAGFESHLSSLFRQLYLDGKIARDPVDRLIRTKRKRAEDLEVVSIDAAGVRKMLAAATSWSERLALGVLVYLGPRRHAVALLRLRDYDQLHGRLRFREKGGKVFWRPIPDELRSLIDSAIAAGVYADTDYLIPPEGHLARKGDRDDRVIWRLVRKVAERAGVDCHVHALRAAFACFYDEQNPGDLLALRDHMGHASSKTTEAHYLRRRDKQAGMERIRTLSWQGGDDARADDGSDARAGLHVRGDWPDLRDQPAAGVPAASPEAAPAGASGAGLAAVASSGKVSPASTSQIADEPYASSQAMGAGGFEPPQASFPSDKPGGGIQDDPPRPRREIVVIPHGEALRVQLAAEGIAPELGFRLAGLTEGEGCFYIVRQSKGNWNCGFVIKLRADDREILDGLARDTGLGTVRLEAAPSRHHPCVRWNVVRKNECLRLLDIFAAYPLQSKKARDLAIWAEAVEAWATIYRNERADWSQIARLARDLREIRKFNLTRSDIELLDDLKPRNHAGDEVPS